MRYMAAGEIRTSRHLLLTHEFVQLHPGLVELLRLWLTGGWVLWDAWIGCFSVAVLVAGQ